jgi:SAM-dependent methyltransferase
MTVEYDRLADECVPGGRGNADVLGIAADDVRRLLTERDPSASERLRSALTKLPKRDRDVWLDAVLGLESCTPDGPDLPRGCTPYIPCSVDLILEVVDRARITSRDVFVDIGAGVGRAAMLTQFLTGAGAIGIEIQQGLVQRARTLAKTLKASRFLAVEGDAAELVRSTQGGTVFFLYCPFSGARLERVLDELEEIARARPIRVCCVHLPVIRRCWLELMPPEDGELLVYRSLAFAS